ncbi:hypothetical protein DFJ74DRAFT_200207 [Hyaloraphidium curvatum]|nr:hypothetical protein DFJ74DRAFT_200207 [Hyaloraphidium curvatum]
MRRHKTDEIKDAEDFLEGRVVEFEHGASLESMGYWLAKRHFVAPTLREYYMSRRHRAMLFERRTTRQATNYDLQHHLLKTGMPFTLRQPRPGNAREEAQGYRYLPFAWPFARRQAPNGKRHHTANRKTKRADRKTWNDPSIVDSRFRAPEFQRPRGFPKPIRIAVGKGGTKPDKRYPPIGVRVSLKLASTLQHLSVAPTGNPSHGHVRGCSPRWHDRDRDHRHVHAGRRRRRRHRPQDEASRSFSTSSRWRRSWFLHPTLARRYPDVRFVPDAMVVDDGSCLTGAAAMAQGDVMLALVRRVASPEIADLTARCLQ